MIHAAGGGGGYNGVGGGLGIGGLGGGLGGFAGGGDGTGALTTTGLLSQLYVCALRISARKKTK